MPPLGVGTRMTRVSQRRLRPYSTMILSWMMSGSVTTSLENRDAVSTLPGLELRPKDRPVGALDREDVLGGCGPRVSRGGVMGVAWGRQVGRRRSEEGTHQNQRKENGEEGEEVGGFPHDGEMASWRRVREGRWW